MRKLEGIKEYECKMNGAEPKVEQGGTCDRRLSSGMRTARVRGRIEGGRNAMDGLKRNGGDGIGDIKMQRRQSGKASEKKRWIHFVYGDARATSERRGGVTGVVGWRGKFLWLCVGMRGRRAGGVGADGETEIREGGGDGRSEAKGDSVTLGGA